MIDGLQILSKTRYPMQAMYVNKALKHPYLIQQNTALKIADILSGCAGFQSPYVLEIACNEKLNELHHALWITRAISFASNYEIAVSIKEYALSEKISFTTKKQGIALLLDAKNMMSIRYTKMILSSHYNDAVEKAKILHNIDSSRLSGCYYLLLDLTLNQMGIANEVALLASKLKEEDYNELLYACGENDLKQVKRICHRYKRIEKKIK